MLFTRKKAKTYKKQIPKDGIKIGQEEIDRVTSVKYLGLTIEHTLNWSEHIKNKCEQARKTLFRLRNFIGKTWGPSPEMVHYAYTSCIRPILSYACFAFAHRLLGAHITRLNKIQRMVHMMMSNNRKGTPAAGLEVIIGTMPIDIYLKGEALKCGYRIKTHFAKTPAEKGHIDKYSKEAKDYGIDKLQSDDLPKTKQWEQGYTIQKPGQGQNVETGLRGYTDGSKTSQGTGAGVCIMDDQKIIRTRAFNLPDYCTVFQAEIAAIKEGCKLIPKNLHHKHVTIMTDSQAALLALDKVETSSRLVKEAKTELNKISNKIQTEVAWIKAHVGHRGNEIADSLAKTGCSLTNTLSIGASKAYVKSKIDERSTLIWNRRWQATANCRQTFDLCPATNESRSKKIRKLNRFDLGILTRYVTGHAHLRRHNKIAGITNPEIQAYNKDDYIYKDPEDNHTGHFDDQTLCRLCRLKGRQETPMHILLECNAAWRERMQYFKFHVLERDEILNWEPEQLVGFFKSLDVENRD